MHPPVTIDFETYSEAGLVYRASDRKWTRPEGATQGGIKLVGAAAYAAHPSTRVLLLTYGWDGEDEVYEWWPPQPATESSDLLAEPTPASPPPRRLLNHVAQGHAVLAHNWIFEWLIWNLVGVRDFGWPLLSAESLHCTAARARYYAYPGALGKATAAVGLEHQKGDGGVLKKLSIPQNGDIRRLTPDVAPELFKKLGIYGAQDTRAQRELARVLPPLPELETPVFRADQRINLRGAGIDTRLARNAVNLMKDAQAQLDGRIREITGGMVERASQAERIRTHLASEGLYLPNMQEDTISAARAEHPDNELLEIREKSNSAAVKKFSAMLHRVSPDGRLRDLFTYYGASRTGRFSGAGVQPQNLPRAQLDIGRCDYCGTHQKAAEMCYRCGSPVTKVSEDAYLATYDSIVDEISGDAGEGDITLFENRWGPAQDALSACVRGAFCAAPGYKLISSDFSSIEAVVLAVLAGEQWRIEAFERGDDIYELSAESITDMPRTPSERHPYRKLGKVAELASGYGGWIGAWKAFGAESFYSNEHQIKAAILKWRAASPNIEEYWGGQWRKDPSRWHWAPELFGMEGCAVWAILNPGQRAGPYRVENDVLVCDLPSGRQLFYHSPVLVNVTSPAGNPEYQIRHKGLDTYTGQWAQMSTYGGKLVENYVQATARDIMTNALVNLEAAGYPIILHVHDEAVAEVPEDRVDIEDFERVMSQLPAWAANWPVRVSGGWSARRFRKG